MPKRKRVRYLEMEPDDLLQDEDVIEQVREALVSIARSLRKQPFNTAARKLELVMEVKGKKAANAVIFEKSVRVGTSVPGFRSEPEMIRAKRDTDELELMAMGDHVPGQGDAVRDAHEMEHGAASGPVPVDPGTGTD